MILEYSYEDEDLLQRYYNLGYRQAFVLTRVILTGRLSVSFSVLIPSISFTGAIPNITYSEIIPVISFAGAIPEISYSENTPSIGFTIP